MKKSELKNLIKECVREIVFEEGAIKTIVAESSPPGVGGVSLIRISGPDSISYLTKLTKTKPPTLGAASRISGVTPAAIIAIMRYLKKQKNNKAA